MDRIDEFTNKILQEPEMCEAVARELLNVPDAKESETLYQIYDDIKKEVIDYMNGNEYLQPKNVWERAAREQIFRELQDKESRLSKEFDRLKNRPDFSATAFLSGAVRELSKRYKKIKRRVI